MFRINYCKTRLEFINSILDKYNLDVIYEEYHYKNTLKTYEQFQDYWISHFFMVKHAVPSSGLDISEFDRKVDCKNLIAYCFPMYYLSIYKTFNDVYIHY